MVVSLTSRLALGATLPNLHAGVSGTVKVGLLVPLTGDVRAWGEPGLHGCRIWADRVNAAGGLAVAGGRLQVELAAFDCQYDPDLALQGARQLILQDGVKLLMMLGGDTFPPVQELICRHRILTTTLLPSDLSPDAQFLIAPSEVHPLYNVTGVAWLAEHRPELRRAAICGQRDALGLPSIATYRAAFEAAGIAIAREIFFDAGSGDPAAIVASMLEASPDILCWTTAYEPYVHALTEAAFAQGFTGQLLSCTADNYQRLIARTSHEFMEGFVFQFPDFDDPMLNRPGVSFPEPNAFFAEFNARFPGHWTAVSWEYAAALDLWQAAVEQAGTTEPISVLAAMKAGSRATHAFGEARWWGRELFGIDSALVGDWPVVVIRDGKARIAEFRSIPEWLDKHGGLLKRHMQLLGQLWDQRVAPRLTPDQRQPGPAFSRTVAARANAGADGD